MGLHGGSDIGGAANRSVTIESKREAPMSNAETETRFASRAYWKRFLQRTVAPEVKSDLKRATPRYPLPGDIKVTFKDSSKASVRRLALLNASEGGLTTKGQTKIDLDTEVVIELNPEGTPFLVRGRIAHCTETLGGFKIGIELRFE